MAFHGLNKKRPGLDKNTEGKEEMTKPLFSGFLPKVYKRTDSYNNEFIQLIHPT
jgi:hypothetical protein